MRTSRLMTTIALVLAALVGIWVGAGVASTESSPSLGSDPIRVQATDSASSETARITEPRPPAAPPGGPSTSSTPSTEATTPPTTPLPVNPDPGASIGAGTLPPAELPLAGDDDSDDGTVDDDREDPFDDGPDDGPDDDVPDPDDVEDPSEP